MFVSRVKVKRFGKLTDGEYTLVDGVNIIRGENSKGKSTLVEAILYGLFGTTALRGTLEDSVTQGSDVGELKVEVDFGPYTVVRSKSSAAIAGKDGVRISGQANVSNYFYELLGVQKGTENKVLVAEQGNMTGVLEGRAGEVNALIEELAGFDQIDQLIERVKEKFPSGNKAALEELIASVEARIEEKSGVVIASIEPLVEKNKNLETDMVVFTNGLKAVEADIGRKRKDLATILASAKLKESLQEQMDSTSKQIKVEELKLERAREKAALPKIDTKEAEAYQEKYQSLHESYNFYQEVSATRVWLGEVWDDSYESLLEELEREEAKVKAETLKIIECEAVIRQQRSLINNEDTCKSCGQDIGHLHKEINERAQVEISKFEKELAKFKTAKVFANDLVQTFRAILAEQEKRERFSAHADTCQIPWIIEWTLPIPEQPSAEKFKECTALIKEASALETEIKAAEIEIISAESTIKALNERLQKLEEEFNSIFPQPSEDLKEIIGALEKSARELVDAYNDCSKTLQENKNRIKQIEYETELLEKAKAELVEELAGLKERLKADAHNQNILAELRKARPEVVNKLWGNVLALTSSIFGSIVGGGEVSKSEKGFVVDGLPVHRLSGSTKAVLGISLRVALREIFAPSAGFMVFDEPSAFCDENRQAAVASALATIQGQVIVITHEDVSDSMADNIIEIL